MDGRGCEDYRCVEVETDVVSNTSGSARVKLVSTVATVCTQVEEWVGSREPVAGPSGLLECILFQGKSKTQAKLWEGVCIHLKDPSPSQRATFQVPALMLSEAPRGVHLGEEGVVGCLAACPE